MNGFWWCSMWKMIYRLWITTFRIFFLVYSIVLVIVHLFSFSYLKVLVRSIPFVPTFFFYLFFFFLDTLMPQFDHFWVRRLFVVRIPFVMYTHSISRVVEVILDYRVGRDLREFKFSKVGDMSEYLQNEMKCELKESTSKME